MDNATKHNHLCTMAFGRKSDAGVCPRCDELRAGAPVRASWHKGHFEQKAQERAAIRNHDCKASRCAIVCTFGDW